MGNRAGATSRSFQFSTVHLAIRTGALASFSRRCRVSLRWSTSSTPSISLCPMRNKGKGALIGGSIRRARLTMARLPLPTAALDVDLRAPATIADRKLENDMAGSTLNSTITVTGSPAIAVPWASTGRPVGLHEMLPIDPKAGARCRRGDLPATPLFAEPPWRPTPREPLSVRRINRWRCEKELAHGEM
jgi:hypothetical protein